MPEVKPEKIISFTSEDEAYPASNLLKISAFSKWKCKQPGYTQSSVTFKFDSPVKFNRLDIGNDGSAFISVEVSRADSPDFEVLLPSSSFMSPTDAKKGISLNRVRIFSGNELSPVISSQKWDIVRVTCTQPFNKDLQYGLAFIRFYRAPDEVAAKAHEKENEIHEEADDILKPGGLFKMTKKITDEQASAAALRKMQLESTRSVTITQHLEKNRSAMDAQQTATAPIAAAAASSDPVTPKATPPSSVATAPAAPSASGSAQAGPSTSRVLGSGGQERGRPTSRILSGVVVAFSGYKNPFRSELRELCLRLGAKYRQDWTDDCTHLICAFPNTPKWNAVKGKGVITSHKWIQACNAAHRRVSWRPYRVGRAPSPAGHVSDHEDDDSKDADGDSDWERSIVEDAANDEWKPNESDQDDKESESPLDSDASAEAESDEGSNEEDSDGDTNRPKKQRPPKAKALRRKKPKHTASGKSSKPQNDGKNAEDEGTDEEIQRCLAAKSDGGGAAGNVAREPLTSLPDILKDKTFYIFAKDLDIKEEETVYRLIITFGGKVELNMNTDVGYVISRAAWCDDFDEALEVCPSLIFVKPEWIYACDKAGKLVPFQRYQIVG